MIGLALPLLGDLVFEVAPGTHINEAVDAAKSLARASVGEVTLIFNSTTYTFKNGEQVSGPK